MSFQIEVLKVTVENKGKYRVAIVDHKTSDGKVDSKKVMSFTNKEVFATLSQSQQGDQYEIVSEKDKNGYWQWTSVVSVGKANGTSPAKAIGSAVRSTYETAEERAARQVYIVRQSSISAAIAFYAAAQPKGVVDVNCDDIIALAKEFEAYVFAKEEVQPSEVN